MVNFLNSILNRRENKLIKKVIYLNIENVIKKVIERYSHRK